MDDGIRDGQCFCGAIRYRLHGAPMFVHCCHCRDCQRQSGSAFAVNGIIEADRIEIVEGTPSPVRMATDSGYPHDIYRCGECLSALWSDYGGRTWLRFLRLATLDDPGAFAPDVHIYTRSKLPWLTLPEGARAFDAYYDRRIEWPDESQRRFRAAKDRVERDKIERDRTSG
jgi:hypothetical protein